MSDTASVYKAMLRPVSFCTLPQGIRWEFVERPWGGNIHGTIRTDRPLTADEQDRFGMLPIAAAIDGKDSTHERH